MYSHHTDTLAGIKVSKNDLRVVLPGMIDELNIHLSLLKLSLNSDYQQQIIHWIQTCLFLVAARCSDPYLDSKFQAQITEQEVKFVQSLCQHISNKTIMPTSFVLPGSNPLSCKWDLLRVLVRKTEQQMVTLAQNFPEHQISSATFEFINRLSSLFYMWARHEERGNFSPVDYQLLTTLPNAKMNF